MAAAGMDESILTFEQGGILASSVLVQMGIKIDQLNGDKKIKAVIDRFNDTYIETMDFLTQILPLAKEQFGRSDNILLPKTPSKKRHGKIVQDITNGQENLNPNIPLQFMEKPSPAKRTTRSSKRNNPPEIRGNPGPTRKTRRRSKKSEENVEQPKVTFVKEAEVEEYRNLGWFSVENGDRKLAPAHKALKRTSSTSPVLIKPIKKKSKSKEGLCIIEDTEYHKDHTSTPVGTDPPHSLSLSAIAMEVEAKADSNEVSVKMLDENHATKLRELENVVEIDQNVEMQHDPPTEMCVELENDHGNDKPVSVMILDSPPPDEELKTKLRNSAGTSINETIAEKNTSKSSLRTVINETPEKPVNEIVIADASTTPGGKVISCIKLTPGKNDYNLVAKNELVADEDVVLEPVKSRSPTNCDHPTSEIAPLRRSKRLSNHITNEELALQTFSKVVKNDCAQQADRPISLVEHVADELIKGKDPSKFEEKHSTSEVPPLRRSKRLSKQITSVELLLHHSSNVTKTASPQKVEEPISALGPEADSQEKPPVETMASKISPEPKSQRRRTRASRRISKVSTGYNRRSSRRSSCKTAYFKKPLPLKQLKVQLGDVSMSEFVLPGSCGKADTVKQLSSNSEHSATESEDECPKKPAHLGFQSGNQQLVSTTRDSSGDEMAESSEGKVAELVQKINRQNGHTSMLTTPNGYRKIRKIGSAVNGSSQKPPNIVGGNIKSFINRQSVKKLDPSEITRQKKLDLQRKEEKNRERKDQAELRKKNFIEEQKRKREEKQKRVAEAKAAREREEQGKKQRQLEEKKQMLFASEQARKKREHEEETKKRLREQRTKEAEARRLREQEERLKRLQEKEEEEKMYRDMLKRKQDQDEQERKHRIQEEKRLHEQKQRERAREQEEERYRKLREIQERHAKRLEKDEAEKKQKEEMERKEKEDKERKQREEEKRIAQLIKDKMDLERKLHEEKQREEKERREREEQKKREAQRAAMLQAVKKADSYMMTPPPAQTRKPATSENYDISDIRSDESTDDEDDPRKKVPYWAQGAALKFALLQQEEPRRLFEELASDFVPHAPDLDKIFVKKRKRFYQRTSSAHWGTPPIKSSC